jgi:hypothetical protein
MPISKLSKTQLDLIVSGSSQWDTQTLLYNLANRVISPQLCKCTEEEYETYVSRAIELVNKGSIN